MAERGFEAEWPQIGIIRILGFQFHSKERIVSVLDRCLTTDLRRSDMLGQPGHAGRKKRSDSRTPDTGHSPPGERA